MLPCTDGYDGYRNANQMNTTHSSRGLIQRECKELFANIRERRSTTEGREDEVHEVAIQAMKIYREQVNDLLVNRTFWPDYGHLIAQVERSSGVFTCAGITSFPCSTYAEAEDCILRANRNRFSEFHHTGKAHVIFRLLYTTKATSVHLNVADLAGSTIGAPMGAALGEGQHIRMSFTSLRDTMRAMKSGGHAPFRNSKLTMLLKQSIEHGHMAFLATVSPASICHDGSLATLRFIDSLKPSYTAPTSV